MITELQARDGSLRRVHIHLIGVAAIDGGLARVAFIGEDLSAVDEIATGITLLTAGLEQTADAVVITDADGQIRYVNPAFEHATGYRRDEVLGRNPRILKSGVQPPEFYAAMWERLSAGKVFAGDIVNRRKDGAFFVEEATITPVVDLDGTIAAYIGVKRDVTHLRQIESTLERSIVARISLARAVAEIEPSSTAETMAASIAQATLSVVEPADAAAIVVFGGRNHAHILATAGAGHPSLVGGRIIVGARARYLYDRAKEGAWAEDHGLLHTPPVSRGSLGRYEVRGAIFAPIPDGDGPAGLVCIATHDSSKASALRDQIPLAMELAALARAHLGLSLAERRMRCEVRRRIESIIARHAHEATFQPIVDLRTGAPSGFEALTRFRSADAETMFADARDVGLGDELEAATLAVALRESASLPAGTFLSLNVSPSFVLERRRLAGLLRDQRRPIVLELTEHEVVDDYRALREAIESIAPKVQIRPDFLKLDRELVREVPTDPTRQALIAGILHFAHKQDHAVVAEGIETEAERSVLLELGVRFGQGFLLGRPAPASAWIHPAESGQIGSRAASQLLGSRSQRCRSARIASPPSLAR